MIPRNSPVEWLPIGHRAPLPRIENAKPTPAPQDPLVAEIQADLDRLKRWSECREGNRIWQHVVDIARGG